MNKFILSISLLHSLTVFGQSELELVNQTLSMKEVKAHIDFLASDELRGRQTGSSEIDIAAKYLATQMSRFGAIPGNESYFQEVDFKAINQPNKSILKLKDKIYDEILIMNGADLTHSGEAVFVDFGTEKDFNKSKVKGRLVIAKAGYSPDDGFNQIIIASKEKRKRALESGARALIELVSVPVEQWKRAKAYFGRDGSFHLGGTNSDFINSWMLDEVDSISNGLKKGKKIKASLEISGMEIKKIKSKNVIATIEGSDPKLKNEFVVYTAHYDHIGVGQANAEGDSIFNGARDNAVGVATMLSAAKNFAKHPVKRSALFIFFTAEEKGLLGSEWFVSNPTIPLNKLVLNLNSDNAGYNNLSAATIIGFAKTNYRNIIEESIEEGGLSVIADPMPEQNLYERSDNVHFAKSGIPSVNISMGISSFDDEIKKVYHNVADNAETLDYAYLEKYFRSYLNLARKIANENKTPFWVDGDKFYSQGIELYKTE